MILRPIVDVSHYQAPAAMDWARAKAAGIVGVIAKVGEGAISDDPAFAAHITKAAAAGISLLGGYIFLTTADPIAQATHLVERMAGVFSGSLVGRFLGLDLEANPLGPTETVVAAAEISSAINRMIARFPVLYMGRYGPDGRGTGLPNATLSNCDLWLPAYGKVPRLPKGWMAPDQVPARHGGVFRLWQDTDGLANRGASVPGLGRVDQSQISGFASLDEDLTAWWGN